MSCKAFVLLLLSTLPLFCFLLSAAPPPPPTFTQAPGVGEVLVVKIESLAPPLCLLGDDPKSPSETVQINVGPTADDPSGTHSPPPPPGFTREDGRVWWGDRTRRKRWAETTGNQEKGGSGRENFRKP